MFLFSKCFPDDFMIRVVFETIRCTKFPKALCNLVKTKQIKTGNTSFVPPPPHTHIQRKDTQRKSTTL